MTRKKYTFPAKVQKLRRIVIPPAIAKALNIQVGDAVEVTISKEVS